MIGVKHEGTAFSLPDSFRPAVLSRTLILTHTLSLKGAQHHQGHVIMLRGGAGKSRSSLK